MRGRGNENQSRNVQGAILCVVSNFHSCLISTLDPWLEIASFIESLETKDAVESLPPADENAVLLVPFLASQFHFISSPEPLPRFAELSYLTETR